MTDPIRGDGAFRRPSLYGSTIENTYAGALSFMRRAYTRDLTGVDLVVSGVPLDLATTFRPGARFGPQAIRAASVQLAELKPFPWGVDPFADYAVVDYGDCWFDAHNPLSGGALPLTVEDESENTGGAPTCRRPKCWGTSSLPAPVPRLTGFQSVTRKKTAASLRARDQHREQSECAICSGENGKRNGERRALQATPTR